MSDDRIHEEAAAWFARQQSDNADWPGFAAWLEADARHGAAYDEIALLDDALERHADLIEDTGVPEPANDNSARWWRWGGIGGGAVAAAIAVMIAVQPSANGPLPTRTYSAADGRTAEVALQDGTQVTLSPNSRLTVTGEQMALAGGAYFNVPHQPGRELKIRLGDFEVRDIGTAFTAVNDRQGVEVAVAEGSLTVASGKLTTPVVLGAGRSLTASMAGSQVEVGRIAPADVGVWRNGRLSFDAVPLMVVAGRVSRYSGRPLTVDPAIAAEPFSGVIALDEGRNPAETLARIIGVELVVEERGDRLTSRRR